MSNNRGFVINNLPFLHIIINRRGNNLSQLLLDFISLGLFIALLAAMAVVVVAAAATVMVAMMTVLVALRILRRVVVGRGAAVFTVGILRIARHVLRKF